MTAQSWIAIAAIVLAAVANIASQRFHTRMKAIEDSVKNLLDDLKECDYPVRIALIERELSITPHRKKWPR